MAERGSLGPIEGDGVLEGLYKYLWEKDKLDRGPIGVSIPDTVVFLHRTPDAWYFTSGRDGLIKRKNRANLTLEKIEAAFLEAAGSCGIVAVFIDTKGKSGTFFFIVTVCPKPHHVCVCS